MEIKVKKAGVVLSSYFAALILGVPLAAWVAQVWNWRGIFLASSLLAVLLLVCTLFSFLGIGSPRAELEESSFFV